jgi:hypothetical protein
MGDLHQNIGVVCAGCGAEISDHRARSCPVCDKLLSEDYQPLDIIRSAHRLQKKNLNFDDLSAQDLFERNKNHISQTAWACVVYSLVPYLGVLFIPFAVATGGLGYYVSVRRPQMGGGRLAVACISLSVLVLAIQLILWWLLYIIPQLSAP